jgi:uncharacterized peroxidase-related enzyme
MARLKLINFTQAASKVRGIFEAESKKSGLVPAIFQMMANSPVVLEAYIRLRDSVAKSSLSPKMREQIALTVAEINRCPYCISAHSSSAQAKGLSSQDIILARKGEATDPKSKAILKFCKSLVDKKGILPDSDIEAARAGGVTDQEILEIVMVVILNLFSNYANNVAETPIDCPSSPSSPPTTISTTTTSRTQLPPLPVKPTSRP